MNKVSCITGIIIDDWLYIYLTNGIKLTFQDYQKCCERRYMHTDDDLDSFIGAEYIGYRLQDGPSTEETIDEWYDTGGIKESQFLIIDTSRGSFTVVNYNEHNGYYGGFDLQLNIEELS